MVHEELDVIVLEDAQSMQEIIQRQIACFDPALRYELVTNSQEFKTLIESGRKARIYVLDDKVPRKKGGFDRSLFAEHAQLVRSLQPEARLVYIGSSRSLDKVKLCESFNARMVDRTDLYDVLKEELDIS